MRAKTLITVLTCLALLSLGVVAAQAEVEFTSAEKEWLKQHETLKIGAFQSYAPVCFQDDKGQVVGMGVDLWKKIGERLGVKVEFTAVPFKDQLEGVVSGRFDSLIGIFPLPSRKDRFVFAKPYTVINTDIWVRPRFSNIHGLADLTGLKVGVVTDDSGQEACQQAGLNCIGFVNYLETVKALGAGKVDALVLDDLVVAYWVRQLNLENQMVKVDEPVHTYDMCFPVKKDNAMLLGILNKIVIPMRDEVWPMIVIDWMN